MWALGSVLGHIRGGPMAAALSYHSRGLLSLSLSPLCSPPKKAQTSFLPPLRYPSSRSLQQPASHGRLLPVPGLLRQRLRLLAGGPGLRPRRAGRRRRRLLRGGRARPGAGGPPPPAGPLPPVGLQSLQAQVQHRGPPAGRHHAGAPAPEEGQPRLRGPAALHLGQPQPTAAQGGDPEERHPVHREPAGPPEGAGGELLLPAWREQQLGARQPAVQLLRQPGRLQQSAVATHEHWLQQQLQLLQERVLWRERRRSFQPAVSVQHRGPSLLRGHQGSRRPEGHGQLLSLQRGLPALHSGKPRGSTRLPCVVRGEKRKPCFSPETIF